MTKVHQILVATCVALALSVAALLFLYSQAVERAEAEKRALQLQLSILQDAREGRVREAAERLEKSRILGEEEARRLRMELEKRKRERRVFQMRDPRGGPPSWCECFGMGGCVCY